MTGASPTDHDYPPSLEMRAWASVMAIYLLDLDSGSVDQLTDLEGTSALPRWSADGERILFHSTESLGTVTLGSEGFQDALEIYMIDRDGSDLVRLTRNDVGDGHPDW